MNHGRDSIYLNIDDDAECDRERLFTIAARRFNFVHLGHSFRCTELEAAIGLAQLEDKDAIVARRKQVAADYIDRLSDLGEFLQLPTVPDDRDHVFMLFPVVLKTGNKRPLINFLEENGIETRDLLPLLNQPIYRKIFGEIERHYPVAQWLNRCGFYIGCHQHLSEADVEHVASRFHEFFARGLQKAAA
jgi:dTDP-4-amino-4,6-dideoxygalactose transaminase